MSENYKKLIRTLRQLFEMDKADLDFGIYRIMNQKRDEINNFLEKDLLPQVKEAFTGIEQGDKAELQKELEAAIEQAKSFGAPEPENAPPVLEIKRKMSSTVDLTAIEQEVYSHLHTFFSRYYDKGDFISLRRYKNDTYAIPYEGEEVKLHWANADQYYIKSSEHLRDYAFIIKKGGDKSIRIKLMEADTEKDNTKSQNGERRFVLDEDNPLAVTGNELRIHFHYVLKPKSIKQEKLNKDAVETIFNQEGFDEWLEALQQKAPTEKNKDRTILEKHLNDYTARNTFDYFIHKDLGGFLRREVDFYVKNKVLYLDDIDSGSVDITEHLLRKIKAIRIIAHKIISFLAQLENFQKKLWLKKKFVVETNYCVTLDRVPENLYPDIAVNTDQHDEWIRLFAIDEIEKDLSNPGYELPITIEFLKANNKLLLDTRFFNETFKTKLLASIENIDDQCDGLLFYSDNFQALNLLQERYKKQIKCVHIDPPYNTATSGFLYKNDYEHSSWIAFMENRLSLSLNLLNSEASYLCHIDENEYENLFLLFKNTQLPNAGTIVWDKRNPMNAGRGIAKQHEYILCQSKQKGPIYLRNKNILSIISKAKELIEKYGEVSEEVRTKFSSWVSRNDQLSGGEKANKYIDEQGRIYQSVSLRAPEPRQDQKFHIPLIHPTTGKPCAVPPNGFSRTPETLQKMIDDKEILFGTNETTQPRQKAFLTKDKHRQLPSLLQDAKKGKVYTDALGVTFPYCHPVSLYEELIGAVSHKSNDIIMDYFAGSGTTGHALINLNREDGGNRKYILVEMGEYFNSVLTPRMAKTIYSDSWRNGKPNNHHTGISHCFKYLRLESYEDTLNNLTIKKTTQGQQITLESNPELKEDYMLSYWLDVETKGSASLLNLDQFEDPFNYKLNIVAGSVGVTKPTKVDLVETFNYLLGLTVKQIDIIRGFKIVVGQNSEEESVLVVWRVLADKDNAALEEFMNKSKYHPRDTEFDRIYVNGDHTLEDPHSKVKMTEIEFKRLMFDVQDV